MSVLVKGNGYAENGVSDLNDKEPVCLEYFISRTGTILEIWFKYRRYEADYTCRLLNKYFSKETLYGGDIFKERAMIDGEVIRSSRSYADPVNTFHEMHDISMNSVPETNSMEQQLFMLDSSRKSWLYYRTP